MLSKNQKGFAGSIKALQRTPVSVLRFWLRCRPGVAELHTLGVIERWHFMDTNQAKLFASAVTMIMEAEKFHLRVAKRLLSPEPISEPERASLLSDVARRERMHEQLEAALEQLRQFFVKSDSASYEGSFGKD